MVASSQLSIWSRLPSGETIGVMEPLVEKSPESQNRLAPSRSQRTSQSALVFVSGIELQPSPRMNMSPLKVAGGVLTAGPDQPSTLASPSAYTTVSAIVPSGDTSCSEEPASYIHGR